MDAPLPVPDHIEHALGQIDPSNGYWRWNDRKGIALQIVCFTNCPEPGAKTLCTIGLSHHELRAPDGSTRQELVLAARDRYVCDELAATLASIGLKALDSHSAFSIGNVFGPAGPLLRNVTVTAILCVPPHEYPSEFAVCSETNPPTHFLRLLPVTEQEALEAKNHGVAEMLSKCQVDGTDLLDLGRA